MTPFHHPYSNFRVSFSIILFSFHNRKAYINAYLKAHIPNRFFSSPFITIFISNQNNEKLREAVCCYQTLNTIFWHKIWNFMCFEWKCLMHRICVISGQNGMFECSNVQQSFNPSGRQAFTTCTKYKQKWNYINRISFHFNFFRALRIYP